MTQIYTTTVERHEYDNSEGLIYNVYMTEINPSDQRYPETVDVYYQLGLGTWLVQTINVQESDTVFQSFNDRDEAIAFAHTIALKLWS